MGRKVRIVQIPLTPLKDTNIKNPVLSHWALLIGQKDLLLEIFPEQGTSFLTPRNVLHVSKAVDLASRKGKFKFGIFPQADTSMSDDEIIKAGNDIILRNPHYFLLGYNCQSFVNDLADAIATPGLVSTLKKGVRNWLWWAKPWIYRDDDETSPSPESLADEAKAELKYLIDEGKAQRAAAGVESMVAEVGTGQQGLSEPSELRPLIPQAQKYVLVDEDDFDSAGDGVVHGLTKSPAYKVVDVQEPEHERDLSVEQSEKYQIGLAIVGQEGNPSA